MDCKAIIDVLLTAAIASFAFLTWRATRSYARLFGLGIFFEHYEKLRGPEGGEKETSIDALRVIRQEFPDIYAKVGNHINPNDRAKIERD